MKLVAYKMFLMYIFKAKIAFSDHAFPWLKTVQSKIPRKASAEEAVNSNFLSLMSESGFQDFRLSEGEHQNNGGSKVAKSGSGHIENNTVLLPVRS